MKKFYLSLCLFLFCITGLTSFSVLQAQCTAFVQNINYDNGDACAVLGFRFPANVNLGLFSSTGVLVASGVTNESGDVTIPYVCGSDVYRVSACYPGPDGATICCDAYVPAAIILPMKVTSFNAVVNANNSVSLNWVSELEIGSSKYVVQKSADGKNFTDMAEIPSAGNSVKQVKYNFSDTKFNSGFSYFRLKQVDKDGRTEYSRVVYVNNTKASGLVKAVSPNPFISDIQLIGISSTEVLRENIRVYSAFGQNISYRITGSNSIAIDPSAPKGLYLLKIKDQVIKMLKQ
jgi:hypothetical protein